MNLLTSRSYIPLLLCIGIYRYGGHVMWKRGDGD